MPAAEPGPGGVPRVSVLVPVLNEERYIRACLESLRRQQFPAADFEVLVVDGGSRDRTRELVQEMARQWPQLRLLENPQRNTPAGLNTGLRHARGRIIVRVDGHVAVAADYLAVAVEALARTGAASVGGCMTQASDREEYAATVNGICITSRFGTGPGVFHYAETEREADTVYLGAFRRDTLERLGGWDPRMLQAEDDELNLRIWQSGGRVVVVPALRSEYFGRTSLATLGRQYFSYGRAKVRVLGKHGRLAAWRHLVPVGLVAWLAVTGALAYWSPAARWLLLASAGAYAAASLAASVINAAQCGWRYLPLLPLGFLVLHLSYGAGFWWGLLAALGERLRGRGGHAEARL
jgi:succinoglycan biosynthesis protein ExoA